MNLILLIYSLLISLSSACHPQFEKELKYLDLYLGIRPENVGEIKEEESHQFTEYVKDDDRLNCDFQDKCLWRNAESDGLLDTSDFWLFKKINEKEFPVQIQPGDAYPIKGTNFIVAGNTTKIAQSALILSAPIACHYGMANVTFNYWLYNHGRIEVMAVRPEPRRGHFMVIERAKSDCHFLKAKGHICSALIPAIKQPYRLAIRAFNLRDNAVGSMVIVNNITVKADLCHQSPFPLLFNSIPFKPRPRAHPSALKDIECIDPINGYGRMLIRIHRNGELEEIQIDGAKDLSKALEVFSIYGIGSSDLKTLWDLEEYWLRAGTQVEVCSVDQYDIPLSCAYLAEEDSPGPIQIDIEPYMKPFRFTIDVIAFDANSMGLVVIDELKFIGGQLCIEHPPPPATTIHPPTISQMFGLQPKPLLMANDYRLSLECDFTVDHCNQWVNDDGKLQYGSVPKESDDFPLPKEINGNVAILLLKGKDASSIRSREVPCAYNALITITYMRTEFGFLRVCALGECMEGKKRNGTLQVQISSESPFEIIIEASSKRNAMIIISSIQVEGDLCPLRTIEQILCDRIKCDFKEHTCNYETPLDGTGDREMVIGTNGGVCTLSGHHATRCILRSPYFDLPAPATLIIDVTQFTFGSRVLLCADAEVDSDNCHELLGPRVLTASPRKVEFPLDESVHQFSLVLFHDKADQFGAARFEVSSIDIRTSDGYQLCF